MFDRFTSRLELKGTLIAQSALRVGAGRSTGVLGSDLPVVRNALGEPYLPGSSLKGVLRAYLESLIRAVADHRKAACDPVDESRQCVMRGAPRIQAAGPNWRYPSNGVPASQTVGIRDLEAGLPREGDPARDAELARRVVAESCLVCQVFGSPWLASKVQLGDLPVQEGAWFGQFEVRNGVAIDRDTETASDQKLYDFEVVPAGTPFDFRLIAENAEPWELGMLMVGLRPFRTGEASLGGARSRGLGQVKLDLRERTFFDCSDGHSLLDYLDNPQQAARQVTDEDECTWLTQFKNKLAETASGGGVDAQAPVQ